MRFKKVLCGVTAALMALSTTAIVAQAEETEQVNILKASKSELNTADMVFMRDGYFFSDGKIYHIGENELAQWRETGKITASVLESDFDLSGLTWWTGGFDGDYAQFVKQDGDGNITERYAVSVDKAAGRVSLAYTLPADWCYTNSDGYTLTSIVNGKDISLIVYDPTGNASSRSITLLSEDNYWDVSASGVGEIVGYFSMTTEQETSDSMPKQSFYVINRDGSIKAVDSGFGYYTPIYGSNENCSLYYYNAVMDRLSPLKLYSSENNRVFDVCTAAGLSNSSDTMVVNTLASKLYGTKVILGQVIQSESKYGLVNLREGKDAELISKTYKSMSTIDGRIYTVQTNDDKWGYIDSNGKELAMFDDAVDFIGDYAPVVKNGKGYFIDRNMNKVSDEIDADMVVNLNEKNLFAFMKNDEAYFVTYVKNSESKPDDTSSDTVSSTTSSETSSGSTSSETSSSSTSSETSSGSASSDTTSSSTSSETSSTSTSSESSSGENNPSTGVALAVLPIALVGGAAVVVTKKRNK